MTTDELRAKFETWCADHARNLSLRKGSERAYWYADTLQAWELWQAAHASRDAEVEALKQDAERYRWLRNNSLGQWEHPIVVSQTKHEMGMLYVGPMIGIELDKDIDAAMQAE